MGNQAGKVTKEGGKKALRYANKPIRHVKNTQVVQVGVDRDMLTTHGEVGDIDREAQSLLNEALEQNLNRGLTAREVMTIHNEVEVDTLSPQLSVEEVQRKDNKYVSANNLLVRHNDFDIPKLEIKPILKEGETLAKNRPLPSSRAIVTLDYFDRQYKGKLDRRQVRDFFVKRINDPKKWSAEALSAAYDLDLKRTKQMLRYYALPAVAYKYNDLRCAVWPAEAMQMIAIKKGMDEANAPEDFKIKDEHVSPGQKLYLAAEIELKRRKKRMQKYEKSENFVQGFSSKKNNDAVRFAEAERRLMEKGGGDVEGTMKAEQSRAQGRKQADVNK